jgi:hypothetical protein
MSIIHFTKGGIIPQQAQQSDNNRVLIIGTAVDGPLNEPVQVRDLGSLEALFGPVTYSKGYKDPLTNTETGRRNGATIPLEVAKAIEEGGTNLWVVRATGTYATNASAFTNRLDIQAIYPGSIYNDVTLTVASGATNTTITFGQPTTKGGTQSITVPSSADLGTVIDVINSHPYNRTIKVNRDSWPSALATAVSALGSGTATLSGGANVTSAKGEALETTKVLYAEALVAADTGTFDTLVGQGFEFAVCSLTGIHIDDEVVADDPTASIAVDFATWLDEMSIYVMPCFGVLATRPTNITTPSSYISYIQNNLLATSTGYYDSVQKWTKAGAFMYFLFQREDGAGRVFDTGARLAVCAGPDAIYNHKDIGQYKDNIHTPVAVKMAITPPSRSIRRQSLSSPVSFSTNIPGNYAKRLLSGVGWDQSNQLTGRGAYIVAIRDFRAGSNSRWVVADDPTAAARNDYFRNAQLTLLINSLHRVLANELYGFIGQPTDPKTLAAMDNHVRAVLDAFAVEGLHGGLNQGYTYRVDMSEIDQRLGVVRISLTVVPATSLREVYLTVAIKEPAS